MARDLAERIPRGGVHLPLILCIGALVVVVVGWLAATSPFLAVVALLFAAFVAILLWATDTSVLIVALIPLYYLPTQTAPGGLLENLPAGRWVGFAVVPLLIVYFLGRAGLSRRNLMLTGVGVCAGLFGLGLVLAAIANGSGWLALSLALVMYLRYPLLFVALVNARPDGNVFRKVIIAFLVLTLLQVPEVVVRFWLGARGDAVSLTLGPWGASALGIYCVYALCLVTAAYRCGKLNAAVLVFVPLLLLPAILGEIKALLIAGPLVVLAILLVPRHLRGSGARRLLAIGAVVAVGLVLFTVWGDVWHGRQNSLALYGRQISALVTGTAAPSVGIQASRLSAATYALTGLRAQGGLGLGLGPGSSLAGTLTGQQGSLHAMAGTIAAYVQTVAVAFDAGLLGLLIFGAMLAVCLRYVVLLLWRRSDNDDHWIGLAALGMWLFYALLGPMYDLVWRYDSASFLFWVVMAWVYLILQQSSADAASEPGPRRAGVYVSPGDVGAT